MPPTHDDALDQVERTDLGVMLLLIEAWQRLDRDQRAEAIEAARQARLRLGR